MTGHNNMTVSRELLRQALKFVYDLENPTALADALRAALEQPAVEPDYRSMYLKVRDELAAAQQRLDTCEALARSVMNDQVGRA